MVCVVWGGPVHYTCMHIAAWVAHPCCRAACIYAPLAPLPPCPLAAVQGNRADLVPCGNGGSSISAAHGYACSRSSEGLTVQAQHAAPPPAKRQARRQGPDERARRACLCLIIRWGIWFNFFMVVAIITLVLLQNYNWSTTLQALLAACLSVTMLDSRSAIDRAQFKLGTLNEVLSGGSAIGDPAAFDAVAAGFIIMSLADFLLIIFLGIDINTTVINMKVGRACVWVGGRACTDFAVPCAWLAPRHQRALLPRVFLP